MMRVLFNRKAALAAAVAATIGLAFQARAWAQEGAVVERHPVDLAIWNCTGAVVTLSGELNTVIRSSTDENGDIHGVFHVNTSGLQGMEAGTTYRGAGTYTSAFNFAANGAKETTASQTIVLAGPGPDNNIVLRYVFKITVNANGEPTAWFANITAECH